MIIKLFNKYFKGRRSYSQQGEDIIIKNIFNLRGIKRPSYIDIGAGHPHELNNTFLFYKYGSVGVNIDANDCNIRLFDIKRRKDLNLNLVVSGSGGMVEYQHLDEKLDLVKSNPVSSTTLPFIFYKYFVPDFLSLDVEYMDFDILKSLNYDSAILPKVICIESVEYSKNGSGKKIHEIVDFLEFNGYYEYAFTGLNSIMVLRSFWFI
jgi:hypothetical protein